MFYVLRGPRWPQDGYMMAQERPRTSQRTPETPPETSQEGLEIGIIIDPGHLLAILGRLGAILGILGRLGGYLGPSWGPLGASWGRLGAVLGPSWGSLAGQEAVFGAISGAPTPSTEARRSHKAPRIAKTGNPEPPWGRQDDMQDAMPHVASIWSARAP